MFFLDPEVPGQPQDLIYSASDLVIAAQCEYQLLRKLDERLGRSPRPDFAADEMLARTAKLGDVHEHRVLEQFLADFGPWDPQSGRGVYDVAPVESMDRATLLAKHRESIGALNAGADVVFQAAFFDGTFHGRSDFLVRQQNDDDGSVTYAVYDTKLARHAKVTALLQLAAYGDQLQQAGITPSPLVTLVLGNRLHSDHLLADVLPVFRERRGRFLAMTAAHRDRTEALSWGDPRYTACGRCDYCTEQVALHRDLLMVAGMTRSRRQKLNDDGILTIDALAAMPPGGDSTQTRLRDQARLQTGLADPDGEVHYTDRDGAAKTLSYRVLEPNTLSRLPRPDEGDIFFDFEGDPLWQDPATGQWGLEYLFGVLENASEPGSKPVFRPFWAHNRAQERTAFVDFLAYVARRRERFPDLRIYHYAPYEKTALRKLSLIHAVGEHVVDELLREGILVDLYETVRHSLRISANSYSIKKLEPFYMGTNLRSGDVTDAGASVVAYANYCDARDDGRDREAARILDGISDYNEYDCLSTLELRNWLLKLAAERGISPGSGRQETAETGEVASSEAPEQGPEPEEARLLEYLAGLPENEPLDPDDQAIALVAAAVGYHRREDKQFWWSHYDRLNQPVADWADTRDVFIVERAEADGIWAKPTSRSNPVRPLRLIGRIAEGSGFAPGSRAFLMYDPPFPQFLAQSHDGRNLRCGKFGTVVAEVGREGDRDVVVITEKLTRGASEHCETPIALTPDQPVPTKSLRRALSDLAVQVGSTLPRLPKHPALDLLRRRPPRLATLASLPPVPDGTDGYITAITAAVADLDHSYLAVQGPPGTGKTHVGSHVIAELVSRGWKVGVVGQSHAVVENMLCSAILKAGVPADRVAKKLNTNGAGSGAGGGDESRAGSGGVPGGRSGSVPAVPWSRRSDDDVTALLASPGGCLIGGTAWTMTGSLVPAGSLDLLVIDEAGQYSLANTLAVSQASPRLLLLGDPQQLPQVTQGKHPEPVDESALGWLSDGFHTLPPERGYFLATSWRMSPELCRAVSELSYDGRLRSAPAAIARRLEGAPAGVECVYVDHAGNSTSSPQEAAEVVRQVRAHLGLAWLDPGMLPQRSAVDFEAGGARPLDEGDILVVAAYNAQVQLIRSCLEQAGLTRVRVGTVDKFQGQEAALVIVSMAASAAGEVPRGMEFLLSRNRTNVAISRGQWRAVVVRSPELTNYLPSHPEGLEQLGGFISLCEPAG